MYVLFLLLVLTAASSRVTPLLLGAENGLVGGAATADAALGIVGVALAAVGGPDAVAAALDALGRADAVAASLDAVGGADEVGAALAAVDGAEADEPPVCSNAAATEFACSSTY